jgi:hypothetical protein
LRISDDKESEDVEIQVVGGIRGIMIVGNIETYEASDVQMIIPE